MYVQNWYIKYLENEKITHCSYKAYISIHSHHVWLWNFIIYFDSTHIPIIFNVWLGIFKWLHSLIPNTGVHEPISRLIILCTGGLNVVFARLLIFQSLAVLNSMNSTFKFSSIKTYAVFVLTWIGHGMST